MVVQTQFEIFKQIHAPQLKASDVPPHFWPVLYRKVAAQEFDAGKVFTLMQVEYEEEPDEYGPLWSLVVKTEAGIKRSDPEQIYLVDHAWTFRIESARTQLLENESLLERMGAIMGVKENDKKEQVEEVFQKMWKFCDFYCVENVRNVEDGLPIWYILDEVGCAVVHRSKPNFRLVPFIYLPQNVTYSLLFPIEDVAYGDVVSRDFVERVRDEVERKVLLLPWVYTSFEDVDFKHIPPNDEYFLGGHIKESLPILSKIGVPKKPKYKLYSEYSLIKDFLTDEKFQIVDQLEEADIFWYTNHFKNFYELSQTPDKFVNQFPFEYVLTVKDLLCVICRRKSYGVLKNLEMSPKWLPITYNLKIELPKFVSYFQNCKKANLDNHWIVKPFNLARGLDTHVTDNLNHILRLVRTGPKIVQKYITNPVLFHRPECAGSVKFDLRYVILLKSVKPLQVFAYRNFFVRFANKKFELKDFQDYEKHFTVMNYTETAELKHMLCDEFKSKWVEQYPSFPWKGVEESIFEMLKEIMECATMEEPPRGIGENSQSRALYAADIMLEWTEDKKMQPKILEVNWTPDCKRACDYYSEFYNDIFRLLFCEINNQAVFAIL